MTDQELLKQAKDQAAQKVSWSSFDHAAENAAVWDLNEITNEAMKIYAELAIQSAREEAESKWIPVKERLPERYEDLYTSETVLVYTTSTYTFMGYYNHKVNGWGIIGDENLREIHVVTHWMPKPERPI